MPERGQKSADLSSRCLGGFVYLFFRNVTGRRASKSARGVRRKDSASAFACISGCERVCLRTRAGAHAYRKYELSELLAADAPCFCFRVLNGQRAESLIAKMQRRRWRRMRTKMNTRKEKEEKREVRCLGTTEAPVLKGSIFWRFEKGETTVQDGRRTTDRGWLEVKKGWAVMK